jgi:hypothetical protein
MRTCPHGNPASQQNHKKIRTKQRCHLKKKKPGTSALFQCVHDVVFMYVQTIKEITVLNTSRIRDGSRLHHLLIDAYDTYASKRGSQGRQRSIIGIHISYRP